MVVQNRKHPRLSRCSVPVRMTDWIQKSGVSKSIPSSSSVWSVPATGCKAVMKRNAVPNPNKFIVAGSVSPMARTPGSKSLEKAGSPTHPSHKEAILIPSCQAGTDLSSRSTNPLKNACLSRPLWWIRDGRTLADVIFATTKSFKMTETKAAARSRTLSIMDAMRSLQRRIVGWELVYHAKKGLFAVFTVLWHSASSQNFTAKADESSRWFLLGGDRDD